MDRQARKSAVADYRERAPAWGVFAVICNATGEAWVGAGPNVDRQQNGLWFTLKLGSSPFASLQAAWREHGEDAFRYEELDRLRPDFPALGIKDELKRRKALWQDRLRATAI